MISPSASISYLQAEAGLISSAGIGLSSDKIQCLCFAGNLPITQPHSEDIGLQCLQRRALATIGPKKVQPCAGDLQVFELFFGELGLF
jgi:hypothetical protein